MRVLPLVSLASLLVAGCSGVVAPTATPSPAPPRTQSPTAAITGPQPADPTATPSATVPASVPAPTSPRPSASPRPSPSTAGEVAEVYLQGPFGSLDGEDGPPGEDAEPAELRPLDQYAQGASLSIGLRDVDLDFVHWTVSVRPLQDPAGDGLVVLSEGPGPEDRADYIGLVGPDAGEWLLRLDADIVDSAAATYHWRLVVPERDLPPSGELEVPAPDLLVDAGRRTVSAEMGGGCYVYSCGDIGGLTPAHRLPRIRPDEGTLAMRLSDGSAFVGWRVTGWPANGSPRDSRSLGRGKAARGTLQERLSLPRGDWYTKIDIEFDLERGALSYFLRVTVE